MLARTLALAALLALPAAALTATPPPQGIVAGSTASLATDARGGNFTLYAPTTTGSCRQAVAAGSVPGNGVLAGLHFDRAGAWTLSVGSEETNFTVQPRPIQVHAAPIAGSDPTDYSIQVHDGAAAVPDAYADLYLDGAFIRHARTDAEGRLLVPHDALPYTGTYTVASYRGEDEDSPTHASTDYPQAFTFQDRPACGSLPAYDAPEQYGTGPVDASLTRLAQPLDLHTIAGDIQVRGIQGAANITVHTLDGQAATPSTVVLLADGVERPPSDLGLQVGAGAGYVSLQGNWNSTSDLTVAVDVDVNGDGRPEATGQTTIPVEREQPLRLVPVGNDTLSYQVPSRDPSGRPGTQALRFRVVDLDGNEGRPPVVPESAVRLEGDLLGSSAIGYNAGGGYWEAQATPLGSDSRYDIVVAWPGKGILRVAVQLPPDGGATASLQSPSPMPAGVAQDVRVRVQRYNRGADEGHLCTPTPACAYETVTDAAVDLFWADTGQPVRAPSGQPYRYDPQGPGAGCSCFELGGTYSFLGVQPDRSGPMAAYATVSALGPVPRHAYAAIPVVPRPVYDPTADPDVVLAGEQTRIELGAPGLTAATRQDYVIRILDANGTDVTARGVFQAAGQGVAWSAALPLGAYQVSIDDRLDIEHGLRGRNGTLHPARIESRPAEARFSVTDQNFTLARSDVGDLRQGRDDTFVLGGGLGAIQQLSLNVLRPDGAPAQGVLTLRAHQAGVAHGLLALAAPGDPPRFGGPQLFPPGQPLFISQGGSSYYLVETDQQRNFTGELQLRYTGSPLRILAWGTGIGDAVASFRSTTSNLNREQPTAGAIHFVPPVASILNITAGHGPSPQGIALGETNVVSLRVKDPTGMNTLEGIEVGLTREVFGPTQRPSGLLHYAAGAAAGTVGIGIRPDATGRLSAVAVSGPATTPLASLAACGAAQPACRGGFLFSPLGIDVLPTQDPGTTAPVDTLSVDLPAAVQEGQPFTVRAHSTAQPRPAGTVAAFGATFRLANGTATLQAPPVDAPTNFTVAVHVDGYPAAMRTLLVRAPPPAPPPAAPPPPADDGIDATIQPSPGTAQGNSSRLQAHPASGNGSAEAKGKGVLQQLLGSPTGLTLLLAVFGGGGAYLVILAMRAHQRRAASTVEVQEEEEEAEEGDETGLPSRLAAVQPAAPPSPGPEPAPPQEAAVPEEPMQPAPSEPASGSPFEQAAEE